MRTHDDMVREVRKFICETSIGAHEVCRIAKELCNCGHCKYFVQHYNKDGEEVDFGHCVLHTPKGKRPIESACAWWEDNGILIEGVEK